MIFYALGRPCFTHKKLAKLRRYDSQVSFTQVENFTAKIFLSFFAEWEHLRIFFTVFFDTVLCP